VAAAAPYDSDLTDLTDLVGVAGADPTVLRANGPQGTVAELRIQRGPNAEGSVTLQGAETIIGRDETATIPIKDPLASRHHARIVNEQGQFWIEDLRSLNGTRVNDEPLSQKRKLVNEDRITIGETHLMFLVHAVTIERSRTGGTR
jgi:pSer/pThr/pTyr-binding forkhead associated (FHA) protein